MSLNICNFQEVEDTHGRRLTSVVHMMSVPVGSALQDIDTKTFIKFQVSFLETITGKSIIQ